MPETPTNLAVHDLLDAAAEEWPEQVAVSVVAPAEAQTYAELGVRSRQAAGWLAAQGVGAGDRIVIISPGRPELIALVYGASRVGAAFVVVDPRTKPFHLTHIIRDAAPRVVVADRSCLTRSEEASEVAVHPVEAFRGWSGREPRPATADDDRIACLIYTSGSTAMPKAVVESQAQMRFAAAAVAARLAYRPGDRVFCCLPLSFDYGLYQILLAALGGATLVLGSERDAGTGLLRVLAEQRISVFPAVPVLASNLVRLVVRRPTPLPALRLLTNTGAALNEPLISQLRERFPGLAVVLMFGLTECKRVAILEPDGDLARPGSVGRALPGTAYRIADEQGCTLPAGEVGELVVRGPHVMTGYWRAPELTAHRFRTGPDGVRELFTGDYARVDADGYLYFVGRRDDVYKQRGTRVSALEVEAAAGDIAAVVEAAVLVPDDDRGAHLVVSGEVDQATVLAELAERLPVFKLPSRCTVVERLPRNPNGKVDKQRLRDLLARIA